MIQLDYSKKYDIPVQDSSNSYYYDKNQATLHPLIFHFYDNNNLELKTKSVCVSNDDLSHNATAVHTFC